MVTELAKTIMEKTFNQIKNTGIYYGLEKIMEPLPGEICYLLEDGMKIRPIKISGGQLWGTHGFSNFWYWVDLESGKEESGYGGFYKLVPADLLNQT